MAKLRKGGNWCSAIGCRNSRKSHTSIRFFRFPKDPAKSKQWVILSRRQDFLTKSSTYLYNNCRLCSVHFEETMYASPSKDRLLALAVPTLFNFSNPQQIKAQTRVDVTVDVAVHKKKIKNKVMVESIYLLENFSQAVADTPSSTANISDTMNIEGGTIVNDTLAIEEVKSEVVGEGIGSPTVNSTQPDVCHPNELKEKFQLPLKPSSYDGLIENAVVKYEDFTVQESDLQIKSEPPDTGTGILNHDEDICIKTDPLETHELHIKSE